MKRNVSRIFKCDEFITVYQTENNPDLVYKEYTAIPTDEDIEELKQKRQKLIAMKKKKNWPNFLIKPSVVERFRTYSFTAGFPYIEGLTLDKFLTNNNITIQSCANFIKKLEDNIYAETKYIFPDIANYQNIVILPSESHNNINFKLIDPDDIQFDEFSSNVISCLISPGFDNDQSIFGMQKCMNGNMYNKNLDIRSMYALLYYLFNGNDWFFPIFKERKNLSEYEKILTALNIPENSSLYENSMRTLDGKIPNEPIGNSLYELIDKGYGFDTFDKDCYGFKHRLIKK